MNDKELYQFQTPEEAARMLADKIRQLRLTRKWKQATLAERAGVSLASLRRFERTGLVSLQSLLRLAFALGRLDEFEGLLQPPQAGSIEELERGSSQPGAKRGSL